MSKIIKKHIRDELNRKLQNSNASDRVNKKLIGSIDRIVNEVIDYMDDIIENGSFSSLEQVEEEAEEQAFKLFYSEENKLKIEECREEKNAI